MHPLFSRADWLTELIVAAAIEVHRDQGPGFMEFIHEWYLRRESELRAPKVVNQKPVSSTDTAPCATSRYNSTRWWRTGS